MKRTIESLRVERHYRNVIDRFLAGTLPDPTDIWWNRLDGMLPDPAHFADLPGGASGMGE